MTVRRARTPLALAALASFVALAALPGSARAEGPSAAQVAQAEDLFQRAKALMTKKSYAQACPMLAESYALAGGGGTLQNLAVCYEEEGKLAFAYNRFIELKVLSKKANRADRVKLADAHIAKLEPRLSRLRLFVKKERHLEAMQIEVDGDEFGPGSWDAGVVVNRGSHTITVRAPGYKTATLEKSVDEGTTTTVEVPMLVAIPKPAGPPKVAALAPVAQLAQLDEISGQRALRTTGFVVGGIGVATLAAGGVFGVLTITTNSAAKNACVDNTGGALTNPGPYNDPRLPIRQGGGCFAAQPGLAPSAALTRSNALRDDARTFANVANVLIPVGVVALGLGTYLVFRSSSAVKSPKDQKKASASAGIEGVLAPTVGGLSLSGTFQ